MIPAACAKTSPIVTHICYYTVKNPKKLWSDRERWINHLGVKDYVLTENNIITGDIKKGRLLTIIILFAKITIYNARMKEKTSLVSKKY